MISVLKETEMKVNEAGGDAAARWLDSRKLRLDAHKKKLYPVLKLFLTFKGS